MKVLGVAALLLVTAVTASAKPRPAGWSITRSEPATLPATSTAADVEAVLVGGSWYQHNPKKMTAMWSTRWYQFAKAGKGTVKGDLDDSARDLAWKVVKAGKRPVVEIDAARWTLEACTLPDKPATLCLFEAR